MSTLIADIGATSSRWVLLDGQGQQVIPLEQGARFPGFNAAGGEPGPMVSALREWCAAQPAVLQAKELAIYGAGCGSPERQERMRVALADVWSSANIRVGTDLLGAARAAFGQGSGLVLILGTGMNAGQYDGRDLVRTMPSLGYIIGDEGSGADIGKQVYRDLFQGRMPEDIREALFGAEGPDLQEVIAQVYRGEAPARFLAAQVAGLLPLLEDPYVHGLITTRFRKLSVLLSSFFAGGAGSEVVAVGSVAHGLRDLLGPCLAEHGLTLSASLADPMEGLVRYHRALVG
ncbi:MAG: hypothetical protein IPN85_06045 [Flavobacteriales bacterium]|nr:hypothetical protein [Flavobacteriales bacterium]MBK9287706.1 hypothetical protein [Flavobacteriales bacterium]MBL0035432.1 hypothetical protein [Flavobacteriales bacterium]